MKTGRRKAARKCPKCGRGTYRADVCWPCHQKTLCLICEETKEGTGSYCEKCKALLIDLQAAHKEKDFNESNIRFYRVRYIFPARVKAEY